jgi:uncharacterized protein involved in copper resistance
VYAKTSAKAHRRPFAAIGLMGLAPYKFDVEATAYIGESGQTAARLEAEYVTLLTNRLSCNGWSKPTCMARTTHAAASARASARSRRAAPALRVYPQVRPYIGVAWERAYAGTADFRRDEGEEIDDTAFSRVSASGLTGKSHHAVRDTQIDAYPDCGSDRRPTDRRRFHLVWHLQRRCDDTHTRPV